MKKHTYLNKTFIAIITAGLLTATACELKVPIKEMSLARLAITRAEEVRAEKYAPEELKTAREQLLQTHELIKNDDTKKAGETAENALKSATAAIDKSLPLLARDSLDEAKQVYGEAEKLYAEEYAPGEFAAAGAALKESEELLGNGKYWESHKKSLEALNSGRAAKDKCLAAVPELMKKIDRLKGETDALWKDGGEALALEELKAAEESLKSSGAMIAENSIKDAVAKIDEAEKSLQLAREKIYRGKAQEKLTAARDALKKAEESDYRERFLADIEKASSFIAEGGTLFDNGKYPDSIEKSDDAIMLLNSVMIDVEKAAEEKRLEEERKAALQKKDADSADGAETKKEKSAEYVVRYNPASRDCLWRIAQRMYKDARKWPLIYIANRDKIKDPDLIFPGQKLVIPPVPEKEAAKDAVIDEKKDTPVDEKIDTPADKKNDDEKEQ